METTSSTSLPLRIFVVENHAVTARYLQLHLESEGHSVKMAATIADALQALSPDSCDVLISDMGLPDGDGWSLLRRLTDEGHNPPFAVAVSGYGTAADRAKSKAAGFRHHLVKPFDPDELDVMLAEAATERAEKAKRDDPK